MIHIILLDPLEKLNIKKDTTIQLALTLKNKGIETYFLFEEDLYFSNYNKKALECFDFSGGFSEDGISPLDCKLESKKIIDLNQNINLHMRLDPPFDSRYLRILWILNALQESSGCQVTNIPNAIAVTNEKIISYMAENSVPSFVGGSEKGFIEFCEQMKELGNEYLVLKPLDLYQGIGVEKLSLDANILSIFKDRVQKFGGAVVVQPFLKEISDGEVRSIYYAGVHIGSIIKTPKKDDFISNIAHGATYDIYELTTQEKRVCDEEAKKLFHNGLPWVAFDLLGGKIQEMNITCPGLLVEVSKAHKKNLAEVIVELL